MLITENASRGTSFRSLCETTVDSVSSGESVSLGAFQKAANTTRLSDTTSAALPPA